MFRRAASTGGKKRPPLALGGAALLCLLWAWAMPLAAWAVPVFTGNADEDFEGLATALRFEDDTGELTFEGNPSGLDLRALYLYYDPPTDVLYVGLSTVGIAGDVDGDGDPGRTSPALAALGGTDHPDFGGGESYALLFDTNGDGRTDVLVGVGEGRTYSQIVVARPRHNSDGSLYPPTGFGAPLEGFIARPYGNGPSAAQPHVEFTIERLSELPGFPGDGTLRTFQVRAFMGSIDDVVIGDDWLPDQNLWTQVCFDSDEDGFTTCQGDCNDGDPRVYPGAPELCDGVDQNCNGVVDEDCESFCGDGIVGPDEECDDGNLADGDGCDSNCTWTACGNGVVTEGEACDDGNLVDGDGCDSNCTPTACGNGVVTEGEACDDGNLADGDGCDSNCTPTACGNGVVTAGEECDDGNLVDGDGCSAECRSECASEELCNGIDDNCDGQIDEGFGVDLPCTSGVGVCERAGRIVCGEDARSVRCDAIPGAPEAVELCNGFDDNCDGQIDEGFDVGQPCAVGVGACEREGVRVCREDGRGTRCDAVPGEPSPEICDGIDNNCDGQIDEGGGPSGSVCDGEAKLRGGGCFECSVRGEEGALTEQLPWWLALILLRRRRRREGE